MLPSVLFILMCASMLSQAFTNLFDELILGDQMLLTVLRDSQTASDSRSELAINIELGAPGMSPSQSRELRSRAAHIKDQTLRAAVLERRTARNSVH